MLSSSKDVNFVGYTYKNFEIVQDVHAPGVGECLGFTLILD
jgi:serine/threonine kinase 38